MHKPHPLRNVEYLDFTDILTSFKLLNMIETA